MGEEGLSEFVCPNCNAPVEEDWAACPSCGTEFGAPAEDEQPAAAEPEPPAKQAPPARSPPAAQSARSSTRASTRGSASAKGSAPPKKGAADRKSPPGGPFARLPLIGGIARRVGTLGVLGLGLLVLGLVGYYLVSNYDVLFAGRTVNTIGPNQQGYVMMMALAAAAGGGLTILGLFMARGATAGAPMAYGELEGAEARAEVEARAGTVTADIPSRASAAPAKEPAAAPAAPAASAAPPAAAAASDDLFPDEEEDEEEVGALELPAAPEAEAEEPSAPEAPPAAEAPASTPAREVSSSDELEDLFGELESEVEAAAEEEEVLYECPNCHGIVKEDDTSCPHCQVVFEA